MCIRDRYKLTYSSDGQTNTNQLILNIDNQWTQGDFPIFTTERFNEQRYAADNSGNVLILNSGLTANGSAITRRYQTKAFDLDQAEYDKDFDRIYIVYNGSAATMNFGWSIDDGAFVTQNVSLSGTGIGVQLLVINQSGKRIPVSYTHLTLPTSDLV